MKIIKKLLSVILVAAMVFTTFGIGITATAESATTETGTTTDSPLEVVVTTNKPDYGKFKIAEITVTVTNTGYGTVENVSAQAVFDDLAPVDSLYSETSKKAETLEPGESFSFSYKAMLNYKSPNVDFFSKIILWFVWLFNDGYTVVNGNSEADIENVTQIKFGKVLADNEVKVKYDNKVTPKDSWHYDVDDNHVVITDNLGNGYIDNEIVLLCEPDITEYEINKIVKSINGQIIGNEHPIYQVKISSKSKEELEQLCIQLSLNDKIFSAHITQVFTEERTDFETSNIYNIPNDPWKDKIQGITGIDWNNEDPSGLNWGLELIEASAAWDYDEYFTNIKIGITDNGFDTQHEDLKITVINDEVNSSENHGTHVAGIIGATANNNKGITGIVWNAELYGHDWQPTKSQERNHIRVDNSYIGIEKLLEKGAKIINLSGGTDLENDYEAVYKSGYDAVEWIIYYKYTLGYKDFLIVQAAGNKNCDSTRSGLFNSITDNTIQDYINNKKLQNYISISDVYDSFIIVGAIKNSSNYEIINGLNGNTCYGEQISIVAPGEDIFSTIKTGGLNGSYGNDSGTSMAAPMVSGVASLVWSVDPNFTSGEVKDIVCNYTNKSAKGYGNDTRIYPIVNAKLAVEEAIKRAYSNVVSGTVKDKTANNHLSEVKVSAIIPGGGSTTPVATTSTDENGNFSLSLPNGTYALIFTHDNYENYGWQVTVNNGDVTLSEPVLLTRKTSTLSGTVKDETTGNAISGVRVEFIDNSTDSLDPVATTTTDENGLFSVNLPYGSYSLSFNHDNYEYYGTTVNVDTENVVLTEPVQLKPNTQYCSITGTVKNKVTESIISGVTVELVNSESGAKIVTTTTDENGQFTIKFPYGDYSLKFIHNDYMSASTTVSVKSQSEAMVAKLRFRMSAVSLAPKNNSGGGSEDDRTVIDSGSCGADGDNVKWTLYDDGELVISGSGEMKDYVGNTETPWYDNRTTIKLIDINNGVTSIGSQAFLNCDVLTNVRISNTVTNIGDAAFYACYSLTNLTLSNKVTNIGDYAFYMCGGLSNINFPNTITHIGDGAFNNCVNLETVTIPYSVINIGYYAFGMCDSLIKITVDNSNLYYSSDSYGVLYNKDKTELITYPIGNPRKSFGVPEGVIKIHEGAFRNCQNLTSVTIPQSVANIQRDAFYTCEVLSSITVDSDNLYYSSDSYGVLYDKNKTELIQYPIGNPRRSYTIPDSVIIIGYSSFSFCKNITSITIPKNVANVEMTAFLECINLDNVYYAGTKNQWNNITIDTYNFDLLNATIHYNS